MTYEEHKEHRRLYMREYRKTHDKEHEYRVAQYVRYLEKYGYKVERAEVKK